MPFWSTPLNAREDVINDPKRKFRFIVTFTGITPGEGSTGAALWYAKTAAKPSFTIAATEHKYLNHTFYYPGAVTWNEVAITLVDPMDPDMTSALAQIVKAGGYEPPADQTARNTMTKSSAVKALGQVQISQIDHLGDPIETWTLFNAFISDLKFGDLAYGDDELVEITVTLKYDWAKIDADGKTAFTGPLEGGSEVGGEGP